MAVSGTAQNALARAVKQLESRILQANWRGETRLPSGRVVCWIPGAAAGCSSTISNRHSRARHGCN